MEDQIFTYIFIAAIILVIAYLASLQAMFSAAEKADISLFIELGSPHIIKNNKPSHTVKILKILFTFKHLESGSKKVILWGNAAIIFFFLILLSYIGLFYVS